MQAEGVSFSLEDKLAIAGRLDELGLDYIEGGYAASNPKEAQFFAEVAKLGLRNSKIAAFGSTRRADRSVSDDVSLNTMLDCRTEVATLVGKGSDRQVTDVLGCSLDENLTICAESVEYLKKRGVEVIFDAEHFYDGYKANPEYAMKVLAAVANAGADVLVLCDTNGGCLPGQIAIPTAGVCPGRYTRSRKPYASSSAAPKLGFTRTTIPIARPPTAWRRFGRAPDTFRARSTAWASAAATPICAR